MNAKLRPLAIVAVPALLGLALTGCAQGPNGTTEKRITDVAVGECFTPDEAHTIAFIVPCTEPHLYEATHAEEFPDGEFPGHEAVQARADEVCPPVFATFVGAEVVASKLYISQAFGPTEQSWTKQDDRGLVCVVAPKNGQPTSTSAKDAELGTAATDAPAETPAGTEAPATDPAATTPATDPGATDQSGTDPVATPESTTSA